MLTGTSQNTDLISVYIPSRRPIPDVIGQLKNEYSVADNIKSDLIRDNIKNAINNIIEKLETIKETPKNGIAIFSGNGFIHYISPSKPVDINLYRCDDHFWLEGIKDDL